MKRTFFPRFDLILGAVAVSLVLSALSPVGAAVITSYGFEQNLNPSSVDSGLTSSDITLQGLNLGASNSGYVTNPAPQSGTYSVKIQSDQTAPTGGTSDPQPTSTDDYMAFSLTPQNGQQIDLDSVSFYIQYVGDSGSGGRGRGQMFLSTNNFSTILGSAPSYTEAVSSGGVPSGWVEGAWDLSGFSPFTSTVYFRLALASSSDVPQKATLIDNIVVDGTVGAIPEPTTALLLFSGLGVLALGRRQKS